MVDEDVDKPVKKAKFIDSFWCYGCSTRSLARELNNALKQPNMLLSLECMWFSSKVDRSYFGKYFDCLFQSLSHVLSID